EARGAAAERGPAECELNTDARHRAPGGADAPASRSKVSRAGLNLLPGGGRLRVRFSLRQGTILLLARVRSGVRSAPIVPARGKRGGEWSTQEVRRPARGR